MQFVVLTNDIPGILIHFQMQHHNNDNNHQIDIFEAVESCFSQVQGNNTWPTDTLDDFDDISSSEESENSDDNRTLSDDNIFMHYDNSSRNEFDWAMQILNRQFIRIKHFKKRLFGTKEPDFKLNLIQTPHGRRFVCSFCKFTAKSWGKGIYHIREVHTGIKLRCNFCSYQTFNPDCLFHHKKASLMVHILSMRHLEKSAYRFASECVHFRWQEAL